MTVLVSMVESMAKAVDVQAKQTRNPKYIGLRLFISLPSVRRLKRSRALVLNGLGLDTFFADANLGGSDVVQIVASGAIARRLLIPELGGGESGSVVEIRSDHPGPEDSEHYNPHVWASPFRAAEMAGAIAGGLAEIDPPNAALYANNAERYGRLFRERDLTQVTAPPVVYAEKSCERPHIFNQYTIRAPERDALCAFLGERGIGTQVYYPLPFHRQPCFADVPCNPADFPESGRAAGEVLSLPIYSELTEEMQVYVADQIAEFYNR